MTIKLLTLLTFSLLILHLTLKPQGQNCKSCQLIAFDNSNLLRIQRKKYKKQCKVCVQLLGGAKRNDYNELDLTNVKGNGNFWETIRPLFPNKIKVKTKLLLMRIVNLLKMTIKLLTFLTFSLQILHLTLKPQGQRL